MERSLWQDRDVLVTGHTGFKGGWLALWLQKLGARVVGFSQPPPTQPNFFTAARIANGMTSIEGDVRDLTALQQVFRQCRPEIVFHLAAQPLVRRSYEIPVETFATNVLGTVNVLEASRHAESVRTIVVITSDKCYENEERPRAYREIDRMGGHDPYSASKGCAELATSAYGRSFLAERGIGVATARAGNVIGGGDWAADRIVPDAVRAIERGDALCVRHPRAVRPWQHVLEPLAGYLRLAERLHASPERWAGAWNFGPSTAESVTVAQLLDLFFERWGDGRWQPCADANLPHEAATLRLNATKARKRLGWQPLLSLSDALDLTARWYREALAGASPTELRVLSCEQIHAYECTLAATVATTAPIAA
jgi:CDP-glucose 4,6-dehydratase